LWKDGGRALCCRQRLDERAEVQVFGEERCAGGCKANRWQRLSQTMGE
jgi:hypothetical protein